MRRRRQARHPAGRNLPDPAVGRRGQEGRDPAAGLAVLRRSRSGPALDSRPLLQRRRAAVVRPSAHPRTGRAVRSAVHVAAALAGLAVRGTRADLRSFRNRAADRSRAGAQGVAEIGRLPGLRSGRGAGRDRRQHRPLRGQEQPGGDRPQDQSGGGRGGRQSTAAAQYRRDHHRRFHRHDQGGQPQAGQRGALARRSSATRRGPRCSRFPNSGWCR